MIEKKIKHIKICGTLLYELPLDEDMRFPPTDSTFSCLIPGLGVWFTGHVIPEDNEKKETDSAPTSKSLEERVKSLEDWTTQMDIEYDANETWKQQMNLLCIKKFDELYSRTEQLSDEHKELKDALEAECDKYDAEFENLFTSTGQWTTIGQGILDKNKREIKNIQQQLSELQQAFIKYAICKKTESPQGEKSYTAAEPITPGEFVYSSSGRIIGYAVPKKTADEWKAGIPDHPSGITEQVDIHTVKVDLSTMTAMEDSNPLPPQEPDIVEQIKAGENRLWELRKSVDCVAAIANSASETVSLKEHVIKLMSIHTGLNITGIRMCNKTYKIHYNCKEKGIYVELD